MFDADEYEEEQRRRDNLFWRMGEFPFVKPRYLIDGFLPETGLVILAGDPNAGKTALASAIALAVAKGKPFAGMETQQGGVLWLCLEESYAERSAVMKRARGTRRLPIYITNTKIPIDTEQGISDLQYWSNEADARLIVVDPLHAAHSGRSLHDGWSARKTLSLLKDLSKGRLILVLHHLAKRGASRVAESVQLSAIATMVILLQSPPPRGRSLGAPETGRKLGKASTEYTPVRSRGIARPRIVTLDCMGRGDFTNRTWHFISRNALDYHGIFAVPAIPGSLAAKILATLNPRKGISAKTIASQLGKSVKTIRNELTSLKISGSIVGEKLRYVTFYKLARVKK
ncbi:MAG: AAA family ATPase [Fimbriimonadales bacterium]